MVASGIPRRLRSVPALLLHLELGTGLVASLAGMERLLEPPAGDSTQTPSGNAFETVRRVAVATLFALHTVRFSIYLRPDQGRRPLPV